MSVFQKIGNNFTSSTLLELFPGIEMPNVYCVCTVDYMTTGDIYNSTTFNTVSHNLRAEFGCDVRDIKIIVYQPIGFASNPLYKATQYRLDQLMLLNIALKFLKKP